MARRGLGIFVVMLLLIAGFIYYYEATKTLETGDKSVRLIQTSGENLPEWSKDNYRSLKDAMKAYEASLVQEEKLDDVTHTVGKQIVMDGRAVYPVVLTYTTLNEETDEPVWKVNTYFVIQKGNQYELYLEEPHFDGPEERSFYQDTDFGRFEYSITEIGKETIHNPDIEIVNEEQNRVLLGKYPVPEEL